MQPSSLCGHSVRTHAQTPAATHARKSDEDAMRWATHARTHISSPPPLLHKQVSRLARSRAPADEIKRTPPLARLASAPAPRDQRCGPLEDARARRPCPLGGFRAAARPFSRKEREFAFERLPVPTRARLRRRDPDGDRPTTPRRRGGKRSRFLCIVFNGVRSQAAEDAPASSDRHRRVAVCSLFSWLPKRNNAAPLVTPPSRDRWLAG